jgi:hypothetical protein
MSMWAPTIRGGNIIFGRREGVQSGLFAQMAHADTSHGLCGDILCLKVSSIGWGARFVVKDSHSGTPTLQRRQILDKIQPRPRWLRK